MLASASTTASGSGGSKVSARRSGTGTATTTTSASTWSVGRRDPDARRIVGDGRGGRAQADAGTEPGSESARELLVAPGDPTALVVVHQVRDAAQEACLQVVDRMGCCALDAAREELTDGGVGYLLVEDVDGGALRRGSRHSLHGRRCDERRVAVDPGIRVEPPVGIANAHADELAADARSDPLRRVVAVREELSATLDQGACLEPLGPHAPADAIASLEDNDVQPLCCQGIRRGETGETRADHADACHRAAQRARIAGPSSFSAAPSAFAACFDVLRPNAPLKIHFRVSRRRRRRSPLKSGACFGSR